MNITAQDVMALRQKTGAGINDCKKALTETEGDIEKAIKLLREKGIAVAAKRADKIAAEGIVDCYIHMGGKIGVMLELNCETDFVAKADAFKELAHNLTMHIAAAAPQYLCIEDVPASVIEAEKEICRAQAVQDGKPANIAEKLVEGRIKKFYTQICLLEQEYVKDPDKKVSQLLTEATGTIGEKITLRRFARWEMGEGLEKKVDNFAAEVSSMVK